MRKKIFTILLALVASVGLSWATTTDLASITDNYTAQDGEILTGTLGVNVKISIADGATVTLLNANINGDKTWTTGEYAGLTCLGDATITIVGTNSVSGFDVTLDYGFPAIYVPSGKTLIINGTGSLMAQSSTAYAAGIGARKDTPCGNIEIQSGKITAIAGGMRAAGIGGAYNGNCGNITISGGIVTAVGGAHSSGIGGGRRGASTNAGHCGNILISGGVVYATSGADAAAIGGGRGNNATYKSNCGTITITNTALKVYADQGGGSTNTIGAAKYGNCGTVTIGGIEGVINADPYTYQTKEDGEIVVDYINAIGTVVYTQECKDKIDISRELYDALEDAQKDLVSNYSTLTDAEAAYAALAPEPEPEPAGPTYLDADFAIDFRTDPYTKVGGGDLPAGVLVEGSMNTGDAAHGYRLPVISIPVTAGNYKVMMGTCSYSNQDATVKTEDGSHTYATLATNNGTCYHNNTTANVVGAIFTVPTDQIIKVYGAEYTPFFSIEKMEAVPAITSFTMNLMDLASDFDGSTLPTGVSFTGTNGSDKHGYRNLVVTVPAKAGNYRLTLGGCQFASVETGAGYVKSETNAILAAFNQKTADCYHNGVENSVSMIFAVDIDQTVTIKCGQYTPYLAFEVLEANKYYINFENAEGAIGTVPGEIAVAAGESWTIPANLTLYKEGYTFAGWSDGVNTYAPGDEFFPSAHGTLHAVYTANTVSVADASTINVKWNFGESTGAPSVTWQGTTGYLLAKGEVDGELIDLKLDIDATSGKFSNAGRDDKWAQVNNGTVFTFPSKEGAVVNVETYSGNATYDLAAGTLTCNTNDYYSYIELIFPAPAPQGEEITPNVDPQNTGVYYSTFFDSAVKYELPAGVEAYVATIGEDVLNLTRIAVAGQVIPNGEAVILKSTVSPFTLTPSDAAPVTFTVDNSLEGTDDAIATPANCYVLGGTDGVVGFYPYGAPNLNPHKAYVIYAPNSQNNAPKHLRFVFNSTTGVESVQGNVQSTKVLRNGQLIIIRNGVEYSVDGKIVK